MDTISSLLDWVDPRYVQAGAAFALVLVVSRYVVMAIRAAARSSMTLEDTLTWVVAAIATAVSAEGSYQVFRGVIKEDWLLWCTFAVIELIMLVSAFRARRHMQKFDSSGVDGIAVWVFAGLTAALASLHALGKGHPIEFLVRLAAPLMAAWLWERGMRLARKLRTARKRINWTIGLERILVRLGLAEPAERDTTEVATLRYLTTLAKRTAKLRALERAAGVRPWMLNRASNRQGKAAIAAAEHTDLATNPETQRQFTAVYSLLINAGSLTGLSPEAFWAPKPKAESPYPPVFVPEAASIPELLSVQLQDPPPIPVLAAAGDEPADNPAPKRQVNGTKTDLSKALAAFKANTGIQPAEFIEKSGLPRSTAYRVLGKLRKGEMTV